MNAPEPPHRQWLHALEDEPTVPGTAMQLARIFADYAARSGTTAVVSYTSLIRQTHRTREAISDAIKWLTGHGWLIRRSRLDGQKAVYDLAAGHAGEKPKPKSYRKTSSLGEPVGSANRSAQQTAPGARDLPSGTRSGLPSEPVGSANRSAQRTATSSLSEPEPVGSANYIRPRLDTSLSPRGLHAALAAVVPDVTERETDQIRQLIGRRPGVRSVAAVMRTEIESGYGPELVAQVRKAQERATRNGPMTERCRSATHPGPRDTPCMDWCTCPCHD